jgi:hypothetical protein
LYPNRGQFWESIENVRASMEAAWSRVTRALGDVRDGVAERRAAIRRPAFVGAGVLFLRDVSDRVQVRVQRFRSQHGAVSALAAVLLVLALLVGGLGLAHMASAGPSVVNANVATHYVNLPGNGGQQVQVLTETTIVPGKGKVVRVRKVVTRNHTTTTRLPGHQTVLPGQTMTVNGPTHTVTLTGPTKTVTETVTQIQTETVTETVEVTTTVEGDNGPGPGGGPGPGP